MIPKVILRMRLLLVLLVFMLVNRRHELGVELASGSGPGCRCRP